MVHAGFTISTIAFILNRTVQATRHLLKMNNDYYESSRAFRLATSEATLLKKNVITKEKNMGIVSVVIMDVINMKSAP